MSSYLTIILIGVIALGVFAYMMRQGSFLRVSGYFSETIEELKKCTWPTWDELWGSTFVVIVAVVALGAFTVGVDMVSGYLIKLII